MAATLTGKTINLTSNTLVATSAQLAAALTDETGTGVAVFSASPALTGTPTAPTAAGGTNTTQIATTAFVSTALAALLASAPAALDTLNELAAALGNDANFAATMTAALAAKASLASPALTGTPTAPTAAPGTNTLQLATTAFARTAATAAADAEAARALAAEEVRALRYVVPRLGGDAVTMLINAAGVPVEVETEFVAKGGTVKPQLYVVPRIGTAQAVTVGAAGAVLAAAGEFGEAVTAFPQGDLVANLGQVEQRPAFGTITGRVLPQVSLRLSDGLYVPLTGGHLPARLLSADPATGQATARRGGVVTPARWRTARLGTGGTMHLVLMIGQSLALGHIDSGVPDRRPYWRDPVGERAWQFRAGDLVQRGPRPLQVEPLASNKAVAIDAAQLTALEPLRGARHAENPQYGQTSVESAALALIGQHLHADDHVLGCVIGTGSTPIADFAPATAHYVNAQAVITAGMARAAARGLALRVWLIWCQGEEDNSLGTLQATYQAGWLAIRGGLAAHAVAAGATFGGTVIQQCLQRPSGITGMATLAQADLIEAGLAAAVVPQACAPGYSGSTHLLPLTYLPLGAATASEIARMLAAPAAISDFVAAAAKGARFQPRLLGTLWQTDDTSAPVTAVAQAVGRIEGLGYATPVPFSQATAGARPVLAAGGLIQFDGTTDYLDGGANMLAVSRNAPAVTFYGRVRIGNLSATQTIWGFASANASNRTALRLTTSGQLNLQLRRLDADTAGSYSTAAGVVVANTTYSVIVVVNYAANTAQIYLNGGADVLAATLTLASPPGPTQDTASLRARLGGNIAATAVELFSGALGRFGFTNTVPTAGEIAAIFAELALDPGITLAPHVASGDAVLTTGTQIDAKITGGSGTYLFDTTTMVADAAGTFGIRVENDSGACPISAVAFTGANTLRITLAASISLGTNPRVEFGLFGPANMIGAAASRVNIRDDTAWPCPCTGQIVSGWMIHHRVSVT